MFLKGLSYVATEQRREKIASPLDIKQQDRIWIVQFNRPEARNPLDLTTLQALEGVLIDATREKVQGMILTGKGKVFASGAHLRELLGFSPHHAIRYARQGARLLQQMVLSPFPILACINGPAIGGALEIALASTLRLATPESFIAHPALRLGLIPAWMGAQLWRTNVGMRYYRYLLLTGHPLSAEEAHRLGIFHEIHPRKTLLSRALEILHTHP